MKLAIQAPPLHTLAIAGRAERVPVNRDFCVGRNHAAHAREMGTDPELPPRGRAGGGHRPGLGAIEVRVTG